MTLALASEAQGKDSRIQRLDAASVEQLGAANIAPIRRSPYRGLDASRKEIRLLVVRATNGDDIVRCEFEQAFLHGDSKAPPYETISYAWGEQSTGASVSVDGILVDVPASCARALRRMRLPDHDRVLWIDAVCIDQSNLDERSHQVAVMADIYSRCTQNLVYLGEANGTTEEAIESIHAVATDMRERTNDYSEIDRVFSRRTRGKKYSDTAPAFVYDDEALSDFFGNAWFKRLWVVQEAALPTQSICCLGEHQVELLEVLQAARWIVFHRHYISYRLHSAAYFAATMFGVVVDHPNDSFVVESPLHSLLKSFRDFEASDAKDHVFGILGLLHKLTRRQGPSASLMPDYARPLMQIMRDAAVCIVRERQDLSHFAEIWHDEESLVEDADFPSWVPRWHRRHRTKDPTVFPPRLRGTTVLDTVEALAAVEEDALLLRGYAVDEVREVVIKVKGHHASRGGKIRELFVALSDLMQRLAGVGLDAEGIQAVLAVTLVAGMDFRQEPISLSQAALGLRTLMSHVEQHGRVVYPKQRHDAKNSAAAYLVALGHACRNRCIFVTDSKSYVGVGPKDLVKGDVVTMVSGSEYPVVLRKCEGGDKDGYTFVGLCYIYDLVDGQAARETATVGTESVLFKVK